MRGCQADDLVAGLLKLDAHFAVDSGIAIVCELQQLDLGLVECRLKVASRFERQILDLFAGYFTAAKSTHKGADHFLDVPRPTSSCWSSHTIAMPGESTAKCASSFNNPSTRSSAWQPRITTRCVCYLMPEHRSIVLP